MLVLTPMVTSVTETTQPIYQLIYSREIHQKIFPPGVSSGDLEWLALGALQETSKLKIPGIHEAKMFNMRHIKNLRDIL